VVTRSSSSISRVSVGRPSYGGRRMVSANRTNRFAAAGVGCPSFGGQRTTGAHRKTLLRLSVSQVGGLSAMHRLCSEAVCARSQRSGWQPGRQFNPLALLVCAGKITWPNLKSKYQMQQNSVPVMSGSAHRSVRCPGVGRFASVHHYPAPNPSVKGTCLRQAPYLER
jgi:hypothetical protein